MAEAAFPGCRYVGVDMAPSLCPDICADVLRLPFEDKATDVTFCCQVLEHLPKDCFLEGLEELRRVTRRRVVISLPDVSPFFYLRLRLPGFRHVVPWLWNGISFHSPFARTHRFDDHGQHYWEIGTKGQALSQILKDIRSVGWSSIRHFRMIERWYWHFFVLDI